METKISDNVQTITAPSQDECIQKLRQMFGKNFSVINWRTVKKGGVLGIFTHNEVEARYVVNTADPYARYGQSLYAPKSSPVSQTEDFETSRKKILQNYSSAVSLGAQAAPSAPSSEKTASSSSASNEQLQQLMDEVKIIRDEIRNVKTGGDDEHETIVHIREMLEENEFSPKYVREIIDRIKKEYSLDDLEDSEKVQESVVDWIGEEIKTSVPELTTKPHVIVLIGPTGVGKTTTVAKIAAMYTCRMNNGIVQRPVKVCMYTIDMFRIAAAQQIKSYGQIMEVPVGTISKEGELEEKITRENSDADVILVDTIGYSPKDYENIGRMKNLLDIQNTGVEYLLTVSACTKSRDLEKIMQQYEIFGYNSVIVTKLDETERVGNLLSVVREKNKSFAFFTTGQKVPRDIERASVVKMLMRLREFKINREHIEEKFSV